MKETPSIRSFIPVLLLVISSIQYANTQPLRLYEERIYQAYTGGNLPSWKEVIEDIEKRHLIDSNNDLLHQLVMAQYGYIAFCLKEDHKKEGSRMLRKANSNLNILLVEAPQEPELIALNAAFTGFEMGINPWKAVYLASKSRKLSNHAYEMDHECLMCLSVKANRLNLLPVLFGGSPEESIPVYQHIISLYESGEIALENDWRYINTLVLLARVFENRKEYDLACKIYQKIIATDSQINWVTNGLYPACLKNIGK